MEQKAIQQIRTPDQGGSAERYEVDLPHENVEEVNERILEGVVGGINPAVKALLADSNKTGSLREILSKPDVKRPLTDMYENAQLPPKKRRLGV